MTGYPHWVTKPPVVYEPRLIGRVGDSYLWEQDASPKGTKKVYGESKIAGQAPRCIYTRLSHLLSRKGL